MCLTNCFPGFYFRVSDSQCYSCNNTCKTCSGGSSLDCIECKNGLLVQPNKTCKAGCPLGSFANGIKCDLCHPSCESCTNGLVTGCIKCKAGLYLLPSLTCESVVPPGNFVGAGGVVQQCFAKCESCSGPADNDCLACKEPEKFTLSAAGSCIDCFADNSDRSTCWFVSKVSIVQASRRSVNQRASATLRFTFDNEVRHKVTETVLQSIKDSVTFEIMGLQTTEYSITFQRSEGELTLDIFYNRVETKEEVVRATPTKQVIAVDNATGYPSLVFLLTPAVMPIVLAQAPNQGVMDKMESLGSSSQAAIGAISTVASLMATLSIIATTPFMAPLVKFFKIFKLISRLKLINVFFGPYLEFVLMFSGMMFAIGGDPQKLAFVKYDAMTRGKLTKFKITPVSVEIVWMKYAIYFLIMAMRLYQSMLRQYVSRRKDFSFEDQIADKIADESRVLLFTVVVIDIFFYSIHCVSHTYLNIPQSRDSATSFVLSWITLVLVIADILLLFLSNKTMHLGLVLQNRNLELIKEKNATIRKYRVERHLRQGNAAVQNGPSEPKPASTADEMGEKSADEHAEERLAKEKQPLKHGKIKVKENSSQAAVNFFTEGIVTEKLKEGRYFNSLSLVKLIAVEPFYVTLQLFPTFQILCLTAIQLAYFVYFCKKAFKEKIFASRVRVVEILVNEVAILCFLMIGLTFQLSGGIQNLSESLSSNLQIVGIVFLVFSCILGAGTIIISFSITIYQFIKTRRNKKMREIYQKEVCGKKTEETPMKNSSDKAPETEKPKINDIQNDAMIADLKPTDSKNEMKAVKDRVFRKSGKRANEGSEKKDLVIVPAGNGKKKGDTLLKERKRKAILG